MKTVTIDTSKNLNYYDECMNLIAKGYHIAYFTLGIIVLHKG